MKNRSFVLAFACLMTSAAQASFELVLVLDKGTSSVHRFDGMTGNYLGSFANGFLSSPEAMTLDQANNAVYIKNGGAGLFAFNYNTGELLGTNTSSSASTSGLFWNGSKIMRTMNYVYNGFSSVEPPMNGDVASTFTLPSSATWRHVGKDNTGDYIWINGEDGIVRTNGVTLSVAEQSVTYANSGVNFRKIAVKGTSALVTSDSDDTLITFNSQNLLSNLATSTASYVDAPQGIAFGHNNLLYVCGLKPGSPSQGQIWRTFSTNTYVSGGTFGSGYLENPVDIAVVVAPEPSTLGIFVLAGGAALLRRRTKRS